MERETITDINTARTLLKREVAIAMHRQLGRGPTFTATLDEMLDMPSMKVPFSGSGIEMMDLLGSDGIRRAIVERMVPKINEYYVYDNWDEALDEPVSYDENHVIHFKDYINVEMFS